MTALKDPVAALPPLPQARHLVTEVPGPRSQALLARRGAAVARGVASTLPVFVERAEGAILLDIDGNRLLDLASGIAVTGVGHAAPEVVAAVQAQVTAFVHTCFMVTPYEGYVAVCEELAALTPGDHEKRSALFSTGAEAVENAVKIARSHTRRDAVVVFDHAYHGRTNLTMAMTARSSPYKHSFGPFAGEVYRAPVSYPFRDPDGMTGAAAAERAITMIDTQVGGENVAAVVVEPVQGEGGFVVPAPGFLPALADYARAVGAVFVADEIQSGLCRTGSWFAVEHERVVPDLVTTAKGIAAGMPLAAVTGRAEIMDAAPAGGLGGTYGGNPVACAAALAVIGIMRDRDLCARALAVEALALPRLAALAQDVPQVGDVRGRGAMLAVELVEPGTTRPDPALAAEVNARCHAAGVVTLTCGTFGNVFRFLPALVIDEGLLVEGLDVFADALAAAVAAR